MKKRIFSIFLICLLSFSAFAAKSDLKVQKWNPYDLEFKSVSTLSNPFSVDIHAEITGPDGIHFELPGFYDGDNTWKIRFSPTKEGSWNIITHSDVPDLNSQNAHIVCVKNKMANVHGGWQVDPVNTHHFIFEDGTRWFPMGYEANWLWALDAKDPTLPTLNPFLDKLLKYGFNFVLMNVYAYDTKWREGRSAPQDYGPPALFPWEGSYESPDFSRFNLEYWRHFDEVIRAMYQRGMGAHLYLKVYNKMVNWPQNGSTEDDLYYRWVIARYAAYPNIIWDLAKEANYEKSVDYKLERLRFIRALDPYKRLLTVHTDIQTYDGGSYNGVVDFRSHQEQSDRLHAVTLKQLSQNPWPVFNVESGYEYGPKGPMDKTYSRVHSPEDVIRFMWEIQMAGGYNAYYYTFTAWDVIRTDDTPPGYTYVKQFTDFFAKTNYWLMHSADSLVSSGYCLANSGKEYIVYQPQAEPFTLRLSGTSDSFKARWFQPLTGKYLEAGRVTGGTLSNQLASFRPPAELGSGPVVLYLFR